MHKQRLQLQYMTSIGGTAVLGTGNYNGGAERTWTTNAIDLGGKAITTNTANTPVAGAAGSNIQTQANNGVIIYDGIAW
jgi:hypothetical protein